MAPGRRADVGQLHGPAPGDPGLRHAPAPLDASHDDGWRGPRVAAARPGSGRVALGVVPVDLHSETRLVVEVNEAVARLGAADQEVVRQGVAPRIAVRFHAEAAARQGRDEMRVQLDGGLGADETRVLTCQTGEALATAGNRYA